MSKERLTALTPLDGRYRGRLDGLVPYASEMALMRARLKVECEYLLALASLDEIPLSLDAEERANIQSLYEAFDDEEAALIKRLETEGVGEYAATNHDVKAIEYYIRLNVEDSDLERIIPWVHFGLTSEDVNNLAYRLLLKGAVASELEPAMASVLEKLDGFAQNHADVPMLARTHGQPATPTTFGKEMAVFAGRLERAIGRLESARTGLAGKLAGASGTFAAHAIAVPEVEWDKVAGAFIESLGLEVVAPTTQVNPCDDLAALFDAIRGVNQVLIDLNRDCWRYISDGYLKQRAVEGETGSSTMPHKVNPIDFENSEGNLSKANSDLHFLGEYLTTSRLQRDLSDSTVKRNMGAAIGYSLLGVEKCQNGLEKVAPAPAVMAEDLKANPAVLGEAIQSVLRANGDPAAYEKLKAATRGEVVKLEDLHALVETLELPEEDKQRLRALEPDTYLGLAVSIANGDIPRSP